ncbi:MAG TPA: polymer-forming cytoskeletal protein [Woeseiaceae bacterium]|nr:polymer-forming cytoskeletal protein [Woeseiaceae bacterium]
MTRTASRCAILTALVTLLLALPAQASINKSITIDPGATSAGASTVNGKVSVGAGATVTGEVSSVNGSIRIEEGATVVDAETVNGGLRVADRVRSRSLNTVNGSIEVAQDVVVDGEVSAVNGRITIGGGSKVANNLGNVNGEIELDGSEVGGDVSTVNGDIELAGGAVVMGNLVVEKPSGWNNNNRTPRIVIGPGSRVEGVIRLERKVKLYISESAEVGGVEGEMTLDDAVRFSGKKP